MPNIDQKPFDENGNEHGEWSYYYENGRLEYRVNYFHGLRHGLCEEYKYNGTLMCRGNWNINRKIGYWYYYGQKRYYLCLI